MRTHFVTAVGILWASAFLVPLAGCSQSDDGLSTAQKQQADRLDEIAKKSGGDFDKLSATDKDYLLKNLADNNEKTARMLLMAKTGGFKGGPPKTGKP